MATLRAGQHLSLNKRRWSLKQVRQLEGRNLELELIGASESSRGMTRLMKAVQYGEELFTERRQAGYWAAHLEKDWIHGERGPALNFKPATDLDLLAAHTRHRAHGNLKNEFSWSYSRATKYEQCPRAYYYHYYAAWQGWRKEAPGPVKKTYLLKNLTDIPSWIGSLVHDTIRFAMARLKADQPVADAELIRKMRWRAQADFDESVSGRYRQNPNQLTGFQEHYYQTNPSKSVWQTAWTKAERCLNTFVNSSLYTELRHRPAATFFHVETLQSFTIAETKVWVQMDLARRQGGEIILYDWKTGEIDQVALRHQLGTYALYIRHAWPEEARLPIRGVAFALADDRLIEFDLNEAVLRATQETIEDSMTQLRELLDDPVLNLVDSRRFPMIDDLNVCRRCQFRELCGRNS